MSSVTPPSSNQVISACPSASSTLNVAVAYQPSNDSISITCPFRYMDCWPKVGVRNTFPSSVSMAEIASKGCVEVFRQQFGTSGSCYQGVRLRGRVSDCEDDDDDSD